jgi:hypothetical protein
MLGIVLFGIIFSFGCWLITDDREVVSIDESVIDNDLVIGEVEEKAAPPLSLDESCTVNRSVLLRSKGTVDVGVNEVVFPIGRKALSMGTGSVLVIKDEEQGQSIVSKKVLGAGDLAEGWNLDKRGRPLVGTALVARMRKLGIARFDAGAGNILDNNLDNITV